jgi:hypothetical protein
MRELCRDHISYHGRQQRDTSSPIPFERVDAPPNIAKVNEIVEVSRRHDGEICF